MGEERKPVAIQMAESTVDIIDDEADRLNMSRSEYIRQHLHAGRRLFQSSGKLDTQMLADLVEDDEAAHLSDDLTTDADGLADDIKAALPTDKDRALTKEQVRKAVFGTDEQQTEKVQETLGYLYERDQIELDPTNGKYYDG